MPQIPIDAKLSVLTIVFKDHRETISLATLQESRRFPFACNEDLLNGVPTGCKGRGTTSSETFQSDLTDIIMTHQQPRDSRHVAPRVPHSTSHLPDGKYMFSATSYHEVCFSVETASQITQCLHLRLLHTTLHYAGFHVAGIAQLEHA